MVDMHRSSLVARSRDVWGSFPDDSKWQQLRAPLERANSFYVSMLYQDLRNQLYIGGFSDRHTFRVQIVGDDSPETRARLARGLQFRERGGLTSAVRDFFQQCGSTMLLCGATTYEIQFIPGEDTGNQIDFRLAQIPPCTYVTRRRKHYQYLPASLATEMDSPQWIELRPETLISFAFDKSSWKTFDGALADLVRIYESTSASTDLLIEAQGVRFPFDVSTHHDLTEKAAAYATRPFGWDARQSLLGEWPEPLLLTRALRFRRFAIELRDDILKRLNTALRDIGQELGFDASLAFPNLPSLEGIDSALEDVATGDRTYAELWTYLSSRF